jgi:murein DD-endopeptidase MepM/ murein hydrolase activator NlpD
VRAWRHARVAAVGLTASLVLSTGSGAGARPAPAVGDRVFPLARSTFLSIIEIHHNWHALRLRYIDGRWQPVGVHEGIDISAERGTPILSMTSGTVENVGWTFYSGTRVGVRGPDGRYYFYAHLSWVAPDVRSGTRVQAGQLLGHVGNTGYGPPGTRDEFPPHLHFGIEVGDTWVNPHPLLVSLYEATVASNDRTQAALDALAAKGAWDRWRAAAARAYSDFET